MKPEEPLSLDGLLSEVRDETLANRSALIRLTLLLATVSAVLAVAQSFGAFGQAVAFGGSLFVGVVYSGMVILILCVRPEDQSITGLWRDLGPLLAKLIWVSLIVAVAVAAGLLFLIVPGLIILTFWVLAVPATVVEKRGVFENLSRSRDLVRGNGLRVFLFLLLLGLMIFLLATIGALLAVPFGVGLPGTIAGSFIVTAFVNPLTAIGPAVLYSSLARITEEAPGSEGESDSEPRDG